MVKLGLMASDEHPWRAYGLFSAHYLAQRLPQEGSAFWPPSAESDPLFDQAQALLAKNLFGLRKASEEECERRFITPILELLGFGYANRKRLPDLINSRLPDYVLFEAAAAADAAFESGNYYAEALAILEAKRWGKNLSEDASGKGKAPKGRSPHYQIRDYLSESDRLVWGILTNGEKWRLYCRRDRASSYFEFDLGRVLAADQTPEEESRARFDFRVFLALFRRSAFLRRPDGSCDLDLIRDGSQHFRAEVERRLRVQVFECVEILARGFLQNGENGLSNEHLTEIYENALILLYRILFVLNAEARELLPTTRANERSRRYFDAYGLERIRRRLSSVEESAEYADDGTFQLYQRLRDLFTLINGRPGPPGRPDKNEELGIPRYNGGLFAPERYPFLERARVADLYVSEVLRKLSFRMDGHEYVAFDYAGLGERHLGSIYEGLLEHRLTLDADGLPGLTDHRGERKAQGAYYTPEAWVSYIVEGTLKPLMDRMESAEATRPPEGLSGAIAAEETLQDDSFAEAVLKLNVCDPAMGSGHFLVEATAFLADAIAAHPTTRPRPELNVGGQPRLKTDGSGEPLHTQEARLAYWRRRVVEACIYGVDLNPLAVELAKLSLWLKTVDRVPLNFLDHHLRCGNSLVGTSLEELPNYPRPDKKPDAAKKTGQLSLTFTADLAEALERAIADIYAIERVPTDSHDAAKEKERLWREVSEELMPRFRAVADLWVAPWFGGEVGYAAFLKAFDEPERAAALREEHAGLLDRLRPFHWELEFPDIFFTETGTLKPHRGFDAVIGNPPWERIKLAENEFFAARSKDIAHAPTAADRKKLIAALPKTDSELWAEYQSARWHADQVLAFARRSGFYPLMGRGDTNYYALFAERALGLTHPRGRCGLLVPSGIATDDTTKVFFQKLVRERRLAELVDFENRNKVFEDVDSRFKFSILVFNGAAARESEVRCGFYLHGMEDLKDPDRTFQLTPEDFRLFNPNTLTCPIFRRRRDVELTRKIYERVPVLLNQSDSKTGNPWGTSFLRMFDMTNDSGLFRTGADLEGDGFWLGPGNIYTRGESRCVPLYEGKMVQMYDHRAATITVNAANLHRPAQEQPVTPAQHVDPGFSPKPQFWVDADSLPRRDDQAGRHWMLGYKDVTAPTNVRTMIPAAIPVAGVGNTFCLVESKASLPGACLLANLSSFALDFAARQKVGGQHLNFFIVEQLPVLPPERYDDDFHGVRLADFVTQRVLELCYTAHDLKGFADDLGYEGAPFPWDEERRLHLKCQLDALYFQLYGLTCDEAGEILETFPIVKRQDEQQFGKYRTRDLIQGYYRAYAAGNLDAWVNA